MRKLLASVLVVLLFSIASPALAHTIDQNQPNAVTYMAGLDQLDLAQSFMQSHGNISGAGISLKPSIGETGNVTITLWDALPNAGGSILATASATGTAGEWVDVFWGAVTTTAMTTYYLVFTGAANLGIMGDTSDPYPDGQLFANEGYQSFPTFDFTFRTYYDETPISDIDTWSGLKADY